MMSTQTYHNLQLLNGLFLGLTLPSGVHLFETDMCIHLHPVAQGSHRAQYVVYLWKEVEGGKLAVRRVDLGFLPLQKKMIGADASKLAVKVDEAARLLVNEIERGEAYVIEDGGLLP
jgi:hypothetical protein